MTAGGQALEGERSISPKPTVGFGLPRVGGEEKNQDAARDAPVRSLKGDNRVNACVDGLYFLRRGPSRRERFGIPRLRSGCPEKARAKKERGRRGPPAPSVQAQRSFSARRLLVLL